MKRTRRSDPAEKVELDKCCFGLVEEHICCGFFILVLYFTIFRELLQTDMETVQVT